jgi:hypothetical protein
LGATANPSQESISVDGVRVCCVRIVPFDIGVHLHEISARVDEYINKHARLQRQPISAKENTLIGHTPTRFSVEESGFRIQFDLLTDGYCVASIFEPLVLLDRRSFNVVDICERRRNAHLELLSDQHPISHLLKEHVRGLRQLAGTKRRNSSFDEWGRNGLAYVFSLYFIEVLKTPKTEQQWRNDLMILLDPSLIGRQDTPGFSSTRDVFVPTDCDPTEFRCEDHPARSGFASWSSVVVIGALGPDVLEDYLGLEVRLQHVWFWVFCRNREITDALTGGTRLSLDAMQDMLQQAEQAVDTVEDVLEPSLSSRHYKILEALLRTSRLRDEASRLHRKIHSLRSTQQQEENRRMRNYRTLVQLLLFAFAYLQGLSFLYMVDATETVAERVVLAAVFVIGVLALLRLRTET